MISGSGFHYEGRVQCGCLSIAETWSSIGNRERQTDMEKDEDFGGANLARREHVTAYAPGSHDSEDERLG